MLNGRNVILKECSGVDYKKLLEEEKQRAEKIYKNIELEEKNIFSMTFRLLERIISFKEKYEKDLRALNGNIDTAIELLKYLKC